jgi:hypothetical protein
MLAMTTRDPDAPIRRAIDVTLVLLILIGAAAYWMAYSEPRPRDVGIASASSEPPAMARQVVG